MAKVDDYRAQLQTLDHDSEQETWDHYLLTNSGLPGPRGNLELARAVALEGDLPLFQRYAAIDADQAPVNTEEEFLSFCGVLGYGRLVAEGETALIPALRNHAADPRWRTREATAMAVQWWASADMETVLAEMRLWSAGNLLERRAVVAGLCEPKLLVDARSARQVLDILDAITAGICDEPIRRVEDFRSLRKTLGYGWSVAVVAQPDIGKALLTKWLSSEDSDIRWIMRENLKKKRLARMDAAWVDEVVAQLS